MNDENSFAYDPADDDRFLDAEFPSAIASDITISVETMGSVMVCMQGEDAEYELINENTIDKATEKFKELLQTLQQKYIGKDIVAKELQKAL